MSEILRTDRVSMMEDYPRTAIIKSGEGAKLLFIDYATAMLSMLCAGVFACLNKHECYSVYVILPALFGVCYLFFLAPIIREYKSLTTSMLSICCFLRCVVLPMIVAITGYSGFERYQTTNEQLLRESVLLMSWELIVISFFLFMVYRLRGKAEPMFTNQIEDMGSDRSALLLIVMFGIVIYIASHQVREYVSFFSLSSNTEKVRGLTAGLQSTLTTGLIYFAHEAFLCLFVYVLDFCSEKYHKDKKGIHVFLPTLLGFITVGTIFGESRATIIYTLFAVVCCLNIKFERYRNIILYTILPCAALVLAGMTVYRLFAVYNYTSYGAAISNSSYLRENYFSTFSESYLLGPQSIAASIEFSKTFKGSFTVERLLYDFCRPFMGLNLFLKKLDIDTSITMYNSWLFGNSGQSNGVFLQITSQGYCYFGLLLSPLFTCLFIWLSIRLEDWMKNTKSLFIYFFLSYTFIRMSTCILGGTMNDYIVTGSMTLIVTLTFYIIQKSIGTIFRQS